MTEQRAGEGPARTGYRCEVDIPAGQPGGVGMLVGEYEAQGWRLVSARDHVMTAWPDGAQLKRVALTLEYVGHD